MLFEGSLLGEINYEDLHCDEVLKEESTDLTYVYIIGSIFSIGGSPPCTEVRQYFVSILLLMFVIVSITERKMNERELAKNQAMY